MTDPLKRLVILALALWLLPAALLTDVLPAGQALYLAERSGKHPKELVLKVPIPVAIVGPVVACVEYGSSLAESRKGKITVKIEALGNGSTQARGSIRGRVRDSHFAGCTTLSTTLLAEDEVVFTLRFKRFPRLKKGDGFVVFGGLIPS